jgi:hypothetical protein
MRILTMALAALAFLIPGMALATTQIPEAIIIEGQKHPLYTNPLESYYGKDNPQPPFKAPNTATWRGYVGTWEIGRDTLYLKSIKAWTHGGEVGLEALFPGRQGPVPATWFTGELRVPLGKVVKPAVPQPLHEKYLVITVEKGLVIKQEVIDNVGQVRPFK